MSIEVLRAIKRSDFEKLDSFIVQGADIQLVSEKERWNYLHKALLCGGKVPDLRMINRLIQLGVDPSSRDCFGNTPLHYALQYKSSELVRLLIEAGANVNCINHEGIGPLREALLTRPVDVESVELLLRAGADSAQKVEGGISVQEYAMAIAHDCPMLLRLFQNNE